jgi:parallel beta-helix repeat protein
MPVTVNGRALASLLWVLTLPASAGAGVFPVTTTADSGDGSLRAAIEAANAAPGPDDITFAIPEGECSAAGVCRITLASGLPVITDPVNLDGTTQPRYGSAPENVCATGSSPSYMRVEVVGTVLDDVIRIEGGVAGPSTLRGLSLGGRWVIHLFTFAPHRIQCNHLGVVGEGSAAQDLAIGVLLEGAAANVVIGTDGDGVDDVAERNVFAGQGYGIYVNANDENRISGNTFGLAADGVTPLDCATGVYLRQGSERNLIGILEDGGSDELEANFFASCSNAIWLDANSNGSANAVIGNQVGLDVQGGAPGNATGLLVGNSGLAYQIQGNRFAANQVGVHVLGAPSFAETDGNCFLGNDTGLEHAGTAPLTFANNFWGAADGPSGVGPGSGDPVVVTGSGSLAFEPWLSACPVPEPAGSGAGAVAATALAALSRARRARATATPGRAAGARAEMARGRGAARLFR